MTLRGSARWLRAALLAQLVGLGACGGGASTPAAGTVREGCGNGVVDGDEQCDDANVDNNDGCSSQCTFEFCGNLRKDRGEDCDGETFCSRACLDLRAPKNDADGDGISDEEEGDRDSDGDGTLDRDDLDSDNDGIEDSTEAGDRSTHTLPLDSDGDGFPDYRDDDSDNDGLPDADEGMADPDSDGLPSFLDSDSDGDGIEDSNEGGADLDGDGVPNSLDDDSDGDGLTDRDEGERDSDGDGIPDFLDADSDGDGVSDADESDDGTTVDSDGDGTPDHLDRDSDNDGVPDAIEGPGDLDGDGIRNTIDPDSDGNGIADSEEGAFDTDGDGIPDLVDTDADGDGMLDVDEIGGDPANPIDTDGDGTPDYLDTDSDSDYLSDADEVIAGTDPRNPDSDADTVRDLEDGIADRDGDGVINALDTDSDGDGYSDELEAGDSDPSTFPIDTDGDGQPDFLDADSDADGLIDRNEVDCLIPLGSRLVSDVDGDGFSDLSEFVIGPDADSSGVPDLCEPGVGVRDFVEFYFELPDGAPEADDVLQFAPQVQKADVFFSVDTTGSMSGEIANLRSSLSAPSTGIIDSTRARVADSSFGVGQWQDFPACGFGGQCCGRPVDDLWELLQSPTADAVAAQAAADALSLRYGGDGPEAGYESLYQLAVGSGAMWSGFFAGSVAPYAGPGRGGVGFREGSVPIVMHITDAPTHTKADYDMCTDIPGASTHTKEEAFTALRGLGARVISVQSGTSSFTGGQLLEISSETDAVVPACAFKTDAVNWRCGVDRCCTGNGGAAEDPDADNQCTLKYTISSNGSGLGDAVVDGIDAILKYGRFDVITRWRDDGDAGTIDTSCFIQRIETRTYIPPPAEPEASCNPVPTQESFGGVAWNNMFQGFATGTSDPGRPGASLEYTVVAQNDGCVAPTQEAQIFTVLIDVMDVATSTVLDTQTMTVIVPPDIPEEF